MPKQVAVTGIGLITPIGVGVEEFWDNLLSGHSGVSEISSFDTSNFKTKLGCEVRNFYPEQYIRRPALELGRASQFALAAGVMAFSDSNLDPHDSNLERIGVALGVSVNDSPEDSSNTLATSLADEFGLAGPVITIPAACAAGNYAIGYAFDAVRSGRADRMIAGGVDPFSWRAFAGFSRLRLISPDLCRPFDRERKGIILGEGAGVLLLESLECARERGAKVYAEILGYGLSCDAYHIVAPHPEGKGAALAMKRALENSEIGVDQVDYISAHGNGTPSNDRAETMAIKTVFGDRADQIAVSSVKALTGHCLAAAGAIGAVACALGLEKGVIPPTWNLQTPDPECDLDYVPNQPRKQLIKVALNNAYAFGGNNACVVLSRLKRRNVDEGNEELL